MKITYAHAGVDNGHNNQNQCDHSGKGKRSPDGKVFSVFRRLVHPDELEEEVCRCTKIEKLEGKVSERNIL